MKSLHSIGVDELTVHFRLAVLVLERESGQLVGNLDLCGFEIYKRVLDLHRMTRSIVKSAQLLAFLEDLPTRYDIKYEGGEDRSRCKCVDKCYAQDDPSDRDLAPKRGRSVNSTSIRGIDEQDDEGNYKRQAIIHDLVFPF